MLHSPSYFKHQRDRENYEKWLKRGVLAIVIAATLFLLGAIILCGCASSTSVTRATSEEEQRAAQGEKASQDTSSTDNVSLQNNPVVMAVTLPDGTVISATGGGGTATTGKVMAQKTDTDQWQKMEQKQDAQADSLAKATANITIVLIVALIACILAVLLVLFEIYRMFKRKFL